MTESRPDNEAIFHAARDIAEPDRRRAYVHEACGGDEARTAHVEALLAVADAPDSLLDSPAGQPRLLTVGQPSGECAGAVIGPYKLLQQIGEGGMGVVWMAEQTQPVQRKVALKVIKPGMDSRQVIARFEAERQALAIMDHVNIARVFDGGATDSSLAPPGGEGSGVRGYGRPYFVMELVHGVPITKYCDDNHLSPRERLELFVPVCQAIQHAHQKGIIHRDIKPSNIMVTLYDGKPVPKVIDFGVAKATEQKLTERTLFTQYGTMVGTLEYMSPEQAEMSALGVDTRSDIYSLGVLLYELLTGSTPLTHKRMKEASYAEIVRMIKEEEPPRPSTRLSDSGEALASISAQRKTEPAKLTKLVRGELDWIVMKSLEKDRNRRYETASGLARDVERYLRDEPVQACPPSAWYRFRKFARRNKGWLTAAAGVFLAVMVTAVSIGWAVRDRAARQADAERGAREDFEVARTLIAENKLIAARQRLAALRAQLRGDPGAPELASLAAEVEAAEGVLDRLQRFLDLIDRAHQAETAPVLEPMLAAVSSRGGAKTPPPPATRWERRPAAAVPFLLKALDCYDILERDDWNTSLKGGLLVTVQVDHIRRTAYEELLWLAADLADRQQEHRSGKKLSREAGARAALVYLGKAESAHQPTQALYVLRARCRQALGEEAAAQADRQLADRTPPTLAVDHYLQGVAAYQANQLAAGIQAFEAALRQEPTHYWSLMWLGHCLCDLGRGPEDFAGAARVFTGCILKRPDHAHVYRCRGLSYDKLGRYDEAVADYSRAIELEPKFVSALYNRGVAYCVHLGQPAQAFADFSRAIDLDPKDLGALNGRGVVYCDHLGKPTEAVADFSRAIDLEPKYTDAWHNRGVAYGELGRYDEAVADFSRAIDLDPKLASAWYGRGAAYVELGRHEEAVADYSRAIDLDPKLAEAWINRGVVYCDHLGQPAEAVADFSRAIELDPKYTRAWYNRGVAHGKLGRYDEAVADYTRAIDREPKLVDAWYNRGVAYCDHLGQPAKAVDDFSRVIDLDPKRVNAWCSRGIAHDRLGRYDEAVTNFSKAIDLDPKLLSAFYGRALAYVTLDRYREAVDDYARAIELDPKHVNAWYGRGLAYRRLGQYDKAVADFDTALKLSPAHARASSSLAWVLATCPDAKLRDPDRAVEAAKKAVQLAPKVAMHWNTLGVAHYRASDWKAAVSALDKAVALRQGVDVVDQLFLAMAFRKLGKNNESREAYNQALQWLERNKTTLAKKKVMAEEVRRFRVEAEEVLELKKN